MYLYNFIQKTKLLCTPVIVSLPLILRTKKGVKKLKRKSSSLFIICFQKQKAHWIKCHEIQITYSIVIGPWKIKKHHRIISIHGFQVGKMMILARKVWYEFITFNIFVWKKSSINNWKHLQTESSNVIFNTTLQNAYEQIINRVYPPLCYI